MASPRDGRVVVLTGANQGIGSHLLHALVDKRYRVAALDVEGDQIQRLRDRSPHQVQFQECDGSDPDDIDMVVTKILDQWGRPLFLVIRSWTKAGV